jgi:arsenate reductase-like glutaredoxin family protein
MRKVKELPFGIPAIDEVKQLLVLQSSEGQPPSLFDVYVDALLLFSRCTDPWQLDGIADHIGMGTKQVKILVYQPGATKATHATRFLLHCSGQGQQAAKSLNTLLHQSGRTMEKLLEGRGEIYRQLGECKSQVTDLKGQLEVALRDKEKLTRLLEKAEKNAARLEQENKDIKENPWGSFNWGESLTDALAGTMGVATGQNHLKPPFIEKEVHHPPVAANGQVPDTVQPLEGIESELPEYARQATATGDKGLGLNVEQDIREYLHLVTEIRQRLPEDYRLVFWELFRHLKNDPALLWEVWEWVREKKGIIAKSLPLYPFPTTTKYRHLW